MTTASLLRANSIALPLRDESVDLIITSPPYYSLRSYQDGGEHYPDQIGSEGSPAAFLAALWAVTDECWRVLKPSGSCWINLGDKFAGSGGHNNAGVGGTGRGPSRYTQTSDVRPKSRMLLPHRYALGVIDPNYRRFVEAPWLLASEVSYPQWVCRMDMVWSKPNGLPESVTDRVRASHEYWFHLTRSERYFAGIDEVRESYAPSTQSGFDAGKGAQLRGRSVFEHPSFTYRGGDQSLPEGYSGNPLGKLPGSVWSIASEPLSVPEWVGVDHYAAFPTEWPRRLIIGWSPTGICTTCNQPRQAIVDKQLEHINVTTNAKTQRADHPGVRTQDAGTVGRNVATITGYGCACPDTHAPTRPARILDPFGGTGTVAMIARAHGRHGINIDLSADYLRLANWRIHESGHWDKALERSTGRRCETPTQLPGQLNLLEGIA